MPPALRGTPHTTARQRTRSRGFLLAFGILLVFLLSVVARLAQFRVLDNSIVIDAPYHVLLTIAAYQETPISVHHGVPIVSLGAPLDKFVPWSATTPDGLGNYYYTSFPLLGFVIPRLIFSALSLAVTLRNLLLVNLGIHALATTVSAALGWRLAGLNGASRDCQWSVAGLCAIAYIWNTEALYSHGVIYWAHSPFQIFWMLQLICLSFILSPPSPNRPLLGQVNLALFGLLSFLGPSTEWSGYVANLGLVLVLLVAGRRTSFRKMWLPITAVVVATLLALATFVLFMISTLDHAAFATALTKSYRSRAGVPHEWSYAVFLANFGIGYIESYGLYLALVLGLIVVALRRARENVGDRAVIVPSPLMWIALAAFPLLENALLLQHASRYTFDRLKLSVVIVVALAVVFPQLARRGRSLIVGAVAGCAIFTLVQFIVVSTVLPHVQPTRPYTFIEGVQLLYRRVWQVPEMAKNAILVPRLAGYENAVYATPLKVRGYPCFTLHRNPYELIDSVAALDDLVTKRGAHYGIWLLGIEERNSICYWNQGVVVDRAGNTLEIVGAMSDAEGKAGVLEVTAEALPFFERAANLKIAGQIIPIVRCDADSLRVFLGASPTTGSGPWIYTISSENGRGAGE